MGSQHSSIHVCCHIFPNGRHCGGAAVRGRACCRHHLDARSRLHNMARARRYVRLPRLLVAETLHDVAHNQAEMCRLLATEHIDPDVATTMLWALQLDEGLRRAELAPTRRTSCCPDNSSVFYHVDISPSTARLYMEDHMQIVENTAEREGAERAKPLPSASVRSMFPPLAPRFAAV